VVPLEPVEVHVLVHPEATDTRPTGGLFVLQRLPTKAIKPCPFIEGSHAYLKKFMGMIKSEYGMTNPQWVTAWRKWIETAPSSDSVNEYIDTHPEKYHIPFRDLLFGDLSLDDSEVLARVRVSRVAGVASKNLKKVETAESVQWTGNGGQRHKVQPFRPLGGEDVVQVSAAASRKRQRKGGDVTVTAKRKRRPSGRSAHVEVVDCDDSAELAEELDEDNASRAIKAPVLKKARTRKKVVPSKPQRRRALVDSSDEDSVSSESSSDEDVTAVQPRQSSNRLAATSACALMRQQVANDTASDESDGSEADAPAPAPVEKSGSRAGAGLSLKCRPRSMRIVESDEEEESTPVLGPDDIADGSEDEEEDEEEVGNSDGEASDGELDAAIYQCPDEMGFVAVKPGRKQRVGGSWRDATYIRIYGCASYYLNWQFRHVASGVIYTIKNVVRNVNCENDSDTMYYKSERISSGSRSSSSSSQYEYFKCIDLMTTQKKYRLYEWMKSSCKKNSGKRVKQVYPGWAILQDDDIVITT
jgi:hypothetical protein